MSSPLAVKAVKLTIASAAAGSIAVGVKNVKRKKRLEAERLDLVIRYKELIAKRDEFLSDPELVVSNPSLVSYSSPIGAELFDAFRVAKLLYVFTVNAPNKSETMNTTFREAIVAAEDAWEKSKVASAQIGDSELSPEQLRHMKKARTQLRHILNPDKKPGEKRRAYTAFQSEMEAVMKLDALTVDYIENRLK